MAEKVMIEAMSGQSISHRLNDGIGEGPCKAAELVSMVSRNAIILRKWENTSGVCSAVCCSQLYSYKSQKSLSPGVPVLYPFHLTLLNFSKRTTKKR